MPMHKVKKKGKIIGYRWGSRGKLYTIAKFGKNKAYKKAVEQAKAVYAGGYKK